AEHRNSASEGLLNRLQARKMRGHRRPPPSAGATFTLREIVFLEDDEPERRDHIGSRLREAISWLACHLTFPITERLQGMFDTYNRFNASQNGVFRPTWRQRTEILAGRLLKFSVQLDF